MKDLSYLPHDYHGLTITESMMGILSAKFNENPEYDVIVLPRTLRGDFNGVATKIADYISLPSYDSEEFTLKSLVELLPNLKLTADEKTAMKQLKYDLLLSKKYNPYLFIEGTNYGHDEDFSHWHYDDANVEDNMTTRMLCSYNRPPTDFLRLNDAINIGDHLYKQKPNTQYWNAQSQDITRHRLYVENEQEINNATVHRRPDTSHSSIPGLLLNA